MRYNEDDLPLYLALSWSLEDILSEDQLTECFSERKKCHLIFYSHLVYITALWSKNEEMFLSSSKYQVKIMWMCVCMEDCGNDVYSRGRVYLLCSGTKELLLLTLYFVSEAINKLLWIEIWLLPASELAFSTS